MHSLWIKAAGILAGVWLIVGGTIWWARHSKPTPESVARYVSEHSLEGKSGPDREKTLEHVADQLNGLSYEERRGLRGGKNLDGFFRSLNADEQSRFLDLTLPAGFKQMMDAFNKMDAVQRKRFVDNALTEMKKHEGEEAPTNDDPNVQKIVQQGLRSFYSDASPEVKMDLSPLIEQMQKNLQGFR